MESIAKFYYNNSLFKQPGGSNVIDISFYDFKESFSGLAHTYFVLDQSEVDSDKEPCLEVLIYSNKKHNPDELKLIFSKILSDKKYFPETVGCKDKKYYGLVSEVLKEANPEKKMLKADFIDWLFNLRNLS